MFVSKERINRQPQKIRKRLAISFLKSVILFAFAILLYVIQLECHFPKEHCLKFPVFETAFLLSNDHQEGIYVY